jgi:hypothetical protein
MIEIGPTTTTWFDYDGAWLYIATCTHNNKYDWRMPTIEDSILDGRIEGWIDSEYDYAWTDIVTPVRDL